MDLARILFPLPRRAPRPQGLPQNPRPQPTLEARLNPGPAPRGGCERAGEGLGGRSLGSRSNSDFPQKQFVWEIGQIDSRAKRPGRHLPWSAAEEGEPKAGEEGTRREKKRKIKTESEREERPTLEPGKTTYPTPPRGGKVERTNQPEPNAPENPYASPPAGGQNVGEIEAKDGLPSADRNNKATLLLTGPFRTAKSSAKDLTPLVLKLQYAKYRDALRAPRRNRLLRR